MEAIKTFADPKVCLDVVAGAKWGSRGPVCPRCESKRHSFLKTRLMWKCLDCKKQFSVKVGTIFEDSPVGLDKWLCAMWMLANCKNGVSIYEIGKDLEVTQKTAWFMAASHPLRDAHRDDQQDAGRSKPTKPLSAARRETCTRTSAKRRSTVAARWARRLCSVCWSARPGKVHASVVGTRRKIDLHASDPRERSTPGCGVDTRMH